MNHWHIIAATSRTRSQHPRIEWVLEQGIVTAVNWVREACVEPGVLRESERMRILSGGVAEVPKNVVQHRIGIAAAAATAPAAIISTLAGGVVVAAAELLWHRNQIQA